MKLVQGPLQPHPALKPSQECICFYGYALGSAIQWQKPAGGLRDCTRLATGEWGAHWLPAGPAGDGTPCWEVGGGGAPTAPASDETAALSAPASDATAALSAPASDETAALSALLQNWPQPTAAAGPLTQRCVCCAPKAARLRRQNSRCLDAGGNFGAATRHVPMSGGVFRGARGRPVCGVYTAPPMMTPVG